MDDFAGNAYPNQDNYTFPAHRVAIIPPPVAPDEDEMIVVQYSKYWTEILMGAVSQLLQYAVWDETTYDPIDCVNQAAILKDLLQTPLLINPNTPTPFWDEDTTADDQQNPSEQEWYGEVEDAFAPADEISFVQNVVIWILTGFVAIAAAPTLPGAAAAALFFRTTAVRFTLSFNKGEYAEIFRVIIDAADYGEVDTTALARDEIIELEVNGLADSPSHDIYIIQRPA